MSIKQMISIFVILFGVLSLPMQTQTQADEWAIPSFSGNDFVAHCPPSFEAAGNTDNGFHHLIACQEYVLGYAYGWNDMQAGTDRLARKTFIQIYDIVAAYITQNPKTRELPLNVLIRRARE